LNLKPLEWRPVMRYENDPPSLVHHFVSEVIGFEVFLVRTESDEWTLLAHNLRGDSIRLGTKNFEEAKGLAQVHLEALVEELRVRIEKACA
jgi:hypothetical protein